VSRLLKLLEWVTVPQAAKKLSAIVGEEVSEADVLQLALEGRIALSVNFVNHTNARRGKAIPLSEATNRPGMPLPYGGVYYGIFLPDGKRVLVLDDDVVSISGVWDLPMIGGESLDVNHRYQKLTDGPEVTLSCLDGVFVQRADDLCQLQEHKENNEYVPKERLKTPWFHRGNFFPAGCLPEDSVFVVRTAELARFQADLSEADDKPRTAAAPLAPRSETTYLNIIGAMVELMLSQSDAGRAHSIFTSQTAIIDALIAHNPGADGISRTTLEGKFAEARRRLHST
jgi:hypothetical protein